MSLLILFIFSFSSLATSRSPSLPGLRRIEAKLAFYNASENDFEIDRDILIADFENSFNTNSIKDKRVATKVYCLLLGHYRKSDPILASEFSVGSTKDCP